jgi:hypothetical protein
MNQAHGFENFGVEHQVCQLLRTRYGLKQFPRMWYEHFNAYLLNIGFLKIKENPDVYIKCSTQMFVWFIVGILVHCFRY